MDGTRNRYGIKPYNLVDSHRSGQIHVLAIETEKVICGLAPSAYNAKERKQFQNMSPEDMRVRLAELRNNGEMVCPECAGTLYLPDEELPL